MTFYIVYWLDAEAYTDAWSTKEDAENFGDTVSPCVLLGFLVKTTEHFYTFAALTDNDNLRGMVIKIPKKMVMKMICADTEGFDDKGGTGQANKDNPVLLP